MNDSKFRCHDCDSEIVEYYNEIYNGKRGKCANCGHDFPLE